MGSESESTQLPLSVKVSPIQSLRHNVKKFLRELRYSPFVVVFSHFLFWVSLGFILSVVWIYSQYPLLINNGLGSIVAPASQATIPLFVVASVQHLTVLQYIIFAMGGSLAVFSVVAMIASSLGRSSMVGYIFSLLLLSLVIMARAILEPLLLFGG